MQHTPMSTITAPRPQVPSDPVTLEGCIAAAREVHRLDAEDLELEMRRHFHNDGYALVIDLAMGDLVDNLRVAVANEGFGLAHLRWAPVAESIQALVDLGASDEAILKRAAEVLR